jgi:ATP-dependent DNA ligase
MKAWNGKDLDGTWIVSYKIDGVRAIICSFVTREGKNYELSLFRAVSRAGKPLYNLENIPSGTYEIYGGTLKASVQAVRTKDPKKAKPVPIEWAYRLDELDPRLFLCTASNLSAEYIHKMLHDANKLGYEGLVLRPVGCNDIEKFLKVKPVDTYDVQVLAIESGDEEGKYKNVMGRLLTDKGYVGGGFTDAERAAWWLRQDGRDVGATIEVRCDRLTPDGKFRHARYVRLRWDK